MDYRLLATTESLDLGTTLQRFERNMEAIRIAKSEAAPSEDELDILLKYVGWGDSQVYKEFRQRQHPVKLELTQREISAIDASALNAHYTDVPVIQSMWKLLEHIGFGKDRNLLILDPSAGNGLFKSSAPDWAFSAKWLEIELDLVTGAILQKLHPNSDVRIEGFQDIDLPDDLGFDLAITNVPFGDITLYHKNLRGSVHNFFLMRMASLLREGGVMAVITSHFSLDSSENSHRNYLTNTGMKLLGAFRLPDNAFKKNARTEVVTDILFFIKDKKNSLEIDTDKDWTRSQYINIPDGNYNGFWKSQYFINHPSHVLGNETMSGTMYGRESYNVIPIADLDTVTELYRVGILDLPRDIYKDEGREIASGNVIAPRIRSVNSDNLFGSRPASEQTRALVNIYQKARQLINADYENSQDVHGMLRSAFSKIYDDYVALYGYINAPKTMDIIKGTPAGMFLQALEVVIENDKYKTKSYNKAPIFFKRTVNTFPHLVKGSGVKDAFAFVVGNTGEVLFSEIERITEKSRSEIISDLRGEIYYDPQAKTWVTKSEYLSGNVREKLAFAQKTRNMSRIDLSDNVTALEGVLPEWKKYTDYITSLQARWIPNEVIKEFLGDLFGVNTYSLKVEYIGTLDERRIIWPTYISATDLYTTYGTRIMDAKEIILRILNTRPIIVYARDEDGNSYKDEQATLAALEKARVIKEKFNGWVYDSESRIVVLEQIFNEKFNCTVNRNYDGASMVFDGLNTDISLHPYQMDGAARIVYSKSTMLSYDVGWGKTFTFLAGIMKSISCGLARKVMLVVPNHLVEQTVKQTMYAYPNVNIMFPSEKDKTKSTRPVFMSRIATGDYDIIVVPFSFFKLMPIDDEIVRETIQEKIDQISEIIAEKFGSHYLDKMDTSTKKRLEKAKMRLEEKLKRMADMKKDSGDAITFDKLGVDMLVTDEFHCLPYNAQIITDQGLIPIGEIVAKKLKVNVKSIDLNTNQVRWMPITGWFNNPQSAPMVRITHESGVLECTANHKIWTMEEGYVEAGNLSSKQTLNFSGSNIQSLECSRVVEVTFLESGSKDQRVFCLEVAETHNFFADGILVSNCYKNVEIVSRMQSVAGLQTKGNQTTFDMLSKMSWMQKQGYKVVGSTATPITNTIGEAYSLMMYFIPDTMRELNLSTFDSWADMFAVVESAPEMTPDGSGFRMNNRFRKFINVEQLSQLIGSFTEMRRGDNEATFARPEVYGGKMSKIVLPSTDELREYVKHLATRSDRIKCGGVAPDVDNMLKITSDGRKAALDMSLVVPKANLSLGMMPKIAALVNNVYKIWLESTPTKSTQLVFCDLGTWKPSKEAEDTTEEDAEEVLTEQEASLTKDVYSIVRNCLVQKGIPEEEIIFAHEAKSPQQRRDREDLVNSGKARVLIGSTAKMGTGMNVQTRLIAIHHLDAPWRPADIEQRNGRGWRQGNYHKKIAIFVYVIEGSFDGYVWQTLETKMSFIDQLMKGHLHSNEMEDISETVLSFAEIKAAASGNHKIIQFVVIGNELKKLTALYAGWKKDRLEAERKAKSKVVSISDVEKHIERMQKVINHRDQSPEDPFEIEIDRKGSYLKIIEKDEAGRTLHAAIADQSGAVLAGRKPYALLGFYRGMEVRLHPSVLNKDGKRFTLGHLEADFDFNVSDNASGTIQSLINTSRSFEKYIQNSLDKIEQIKLEEIKEADALAKPWELQQKYNDIQLKYAELSAELSKSRENPLDELEKRKETERAMVEESEIVFSEITEYIIECNHLPHYLSMFSTLDGSGMIEQLSRQDETPIENIVREKIEVIKRAAVEMEVEFAQIFRNVIIKKKSKKSGLTFESSQLAFF